MEILNYCMHQEVQMPCQKWNHGFIECDAYHIANHIETSLKERLIYIYFSESESI